MDFKNRPNGRGIMVNSEGTITEGNWVKGSKEGVNYCKMVNGTTFLGVFKNDAPNGYGTETKTNGEIYCGYMKNGLKYGKGTLNYKNGTKYKGNFINGLKHGEGIEDQKDFIFEGQFKNDLWHGQGKYTNKKIFKTVSAEFKDGKMIKSNHV